MPNNDKNIFLRSLLRRHGSLKISLMSLFLYVPLSVALVVLFDLLLKDAVIQTDLLIGTIIPILLCPPVTYVFARMAQRLDEAESTLLKTSQTDSYRLRYLDTMDRITQISMSSEDIDDVLGGILDLILEIFHADRAWFLFPCDPDAPTWSVPIERTRPEWPGMFALGVSMPMQADVAGP